MAEPHGVIAHTTDRRTDYLYRVSLKCLVRNANGQVLVVKETGRDWWDLPGGGMDHGENLHTAIAREMHEEVNMQGDFTYTIIFAEDPGFLTPQNLWQLRLIFEVTPQSLHFSAGDDGDQIAFKNPAEFKNSPLLTEQRIYTYSTLLRKE
jgi:8-oxo-dGTP pyrophosphatase MutT (NUDIX family)